MIARFAKRLSVLVVVSLISGWGSWAQSAQLVSSRRFAGHGQGGVHKDYSEKLAFVGYMG